MKLQWLGHSAFKLIESTGTSVISDPFEASTVGYGMAYVNADAITSSVGKSDHNNFKGVKGNPTILNSVGSYDIKGIAVDSFLSNHEENATSNSLIFKMRLDGVIVCHMGDVNIPCSLENIDELIPVNILLLPIGGGEHTIDAEQAKEYVDKIMPDIVIPMHYRTKDSELDIDKLDAFLKLFNSEDIIEEKDTTIEFDRFDFNGESTKILIPTRFKG